MPFRKMTEQENTENDKLIDKVRKKIETLQDNLQKLETKKTEGIWYSDIDWNKKGGT